MISRRFGPIDGRRHDLYSGMTRQLESSPAFHNKLIYRNPAYGCANVFWCTYKGCRIAAP